MLFNRPGQQFHAIKFDANGRVSGQAAFASVTLSIDGGPYVPLNDTNPTEVGTTGEYLWQLTQAETNGYELSFAPVTASAGVEILGMPSNVIYTLDASTIAVNVLPAIGVVSDRSPGLTLKPFVGETILQAITLYEDDRVTPVDMSSKTLVIVFETRQGLDVATVASGDIAISGDDDNIVTFAYPAAVTASERVLRFALRDAALPNTVYLQGLLSVQRAPKVDAP
jgi:hypothetical protein